MTKFRSYIVKGLASFLLYSLINLTFITGTEYLLWNSSPEIRGKMDIQRVIDREIEKRGINKKIKLEITNKLSSQSKKTGKNTYTIYFSENIRLHSIEHEINHIALGHLDIEEYLSNKKFYFLLDPYYFYIEEPQAVIHDLESFLFRDLNKQF